MKKGFSSFGFIVIAFAIIFAFKDNPAEPDRSRHHYSSRSCISSTQDHNAISDDWWGLQVTEEEEFKREDNTDNADDESQKSEWCDAIEN